MFRKLMIFVCLISFSPAALGAQGLPALADQSGASASEERAGGPANLNLSPPPARDSGMVQLAANDRTADCAESPRPHKTHSGMTFKDFAEVHFGEYRWIYWVGAVTGIVLLHVLAFSH
jgi:hypothetical protein